MSTISASTTSTTAYKVIADTTGALVFQTGSTPSTAMNIDSSGFITNTPNSSPSGLIQGYQYYRLNTAIVGSNATGAQSYLGVGVTLASSTVYEFEIYLALAKTAGTTSNVLSHLFGGTATVNNILYFAIENDFTGAINTRGTTTGGTSINVATAVGISNSMGSANQVFSTLLKGTVSIATGGTFIPQYSLSAAPGGAYTTQIGCYMKIAPLGAAGSNTSIGAWA